VTHATGEHRERQRPNGAAARTALGGESAESPQRVCRETRTEPPLGCRPGAHTDRAAAPGFGIGAPRPSAALDESGSGCRARRRTVRPCAPSSDVWPHPRAGPAWHQVFRVFAAACHRAPDHALPSSQGPPTISSDLDTTTATRWLKPPYPRARRRKRSRTLATAYSDLPPSRGAMCHLRHLSVLAGVRNKQTFP